MSDNFPGASTSESELPPLKTEQEAAEWVLNRGGRVNASLDGAQARHLVKGFQGNVSWIREIILHDATPAEINAFASLEDLQIFDISFHPHLTREHLNSLSKIRNQKQFRIGTRELSDINDTDVHNLVSGSPRCELIIINAIGLDGSFLDALESDALTKLCIRSPRMEIVEEQRGRISVESLRKAARFRNLQILTLEMSRLTPKHLAAIGQLPAIEVLDLSYVLGIESAIDELKSLSTLRELRVRGVKIDQASVDALITMKSLKVLNIKETSLSKQQVAAIKSGLPNCEVISDI